MSGRRSLTWLGLTPEPERELPSTVAALRSPASDADMTAPGLAAAERRRVERLILHGTERSWLRYLAEVTDLVTAVASGARRGDRAAALLAGEVVLEHHRMLIGLPGTGYGRTAADRRALETAVSSLRRTSPARSDTTPATAEATTPDATNPAGTTTTAAEAPPETPQPPHTPGTRQGRQGGRG
ncbi:hypothetical protein ABZ532_09715 [Streptomyces sp. NPDC019396]|uniref:hypothetical protein n=1 Tax=Streptomyces sp. NPDC019396 TaxID=3154687 RepID=UPI0033F9F0B8